MKGRNNPTPWRLEGETIRDANGDVVVSALNPCGIATRERIVQAVNERKAGNTAKLRKAIDYLCEKMAELDATFDPSDVPCLRAALAHEKELKGESDGSK